MRVSIIMTLAALPVLSACGERTDLRKGTATTAPALRRDVAAICRPSIAYPFVLQLPPDSGYELNTVRVDSAALVRWFQVQLAHRIPEQRIVMVRMDSTRRDALRWIVPAIERAGAGAYEPDSTCVPPLRAHAVDAPAV